MLVRRPAEHVRALCEFWKSWNLQKLVLKLPGVSATFTAYAEFDCGLCDVRLTNQDAAPAEFLI